MHHTMSRVRFGATWLVRAAIIGLLAAACSSGSDVEDLPPLAEAADDQATSSSTSSSSSSSTTSSSSTSSSTTEPTTPSGKPDLEIPTEWDSELDEIFGRYLLYWQAIDIALAPPEADPDYPPLKDLAVPAAYDDLHQQIADIKAAGHVYVEPPESTTAHVVRLPNPTFTGKVEGNEVVIQDCYTSAQVRQTIEGEVIDDEVGRRLLNINMLVVDGEWTVLAVVRAGADSAGYDECIDSGNF